MSCYCVNSFDFSSQTSKNDSRTCGIPAGLVRRTTAQYWFSHKLHWLCIFQTSEWYIRTSDLYNPLARRTSAFNLKFRSLRMTQKCLVNQYRISSSNSLQVVILFILPPSLPIFIVGRLQNLNVEAHRVEAFVFSDSLHSPTFVLTLSTSLQQWLSMTVGWVLQWPHVHLEMSNDLVIHLHDMFDSILGYG